MSKIVALVGKSQKSRHLAPFDDPSVDIWSMNETLSKGIIPRANAMFQMHLPDVWRSPNAHGDPGYYAWITKPHDFPIWMNAMYEDVPNCLRFPSNSLSEAVKAIVAGRPIEHFNTSTLSYMLALAIWMEYSEIQIFGFTLAESYAPQRDSAFFWFGYAASRGIKITLPDNSDLFKVKMYGYE